jgi:hypothetical protein
VDAFDRKSSMLESFDPVTYTTKPLWKSPQYLSVQDMKINGTLLVMAGKCRNIETSFSKVLTRVTGSNGNVHTYDINTGIVKDLNATATTISLDPNSNTIYLAGGSIRSVSQQTELTIF